ncbi:S9 family peptidase [Brachybacterium sillae]|uniref:S9 family peptidase n=1 Tax=Brachybacterium sillae TaxID=2810536 RepID=UPI00217E35A6|nr:prolyl oligopeptidase family serine peptidase [Brachybacterium sillae]
MRAIVEPQVVELPDGRRELWAVCEDHTRPAPADPTPAAGAGVGPAPVVDPHIERYLVAIPLDGSAAQDPARLRQITPSARFTAAARLSPDGRLLAWITWEHPRMPWDGTELHVAPMEDPDGDGPVAVAGQVIAGGESVSVLQPEWVDEDRLILVSDESGWWNPWLWMDGMGLRPVLQQDEEFAGPLWSIGTTWMHVLDTDRVLVQHGRAQQRLGVLDLRTARIADLDQPLTSLSAVAVGPRGSGSHGGPVGSVGPVGPGGAAGSGGRALAILGASPTRFPALLRGRLVTDAQGAHWRDERVVRSSRTDTPDPAALPVVEELQVTTADGRVIHAVLHRPRLQGVEGPAGELPPFVAFVHGGPTSQAPLALNLAAALYTSRGIGVVDVNYGGSTGYGRAYRERLTGQWGVVDVADTVAVMEHLVAEGIADGRRLAIEGGSAGGWTTLACLTRTDTFAAGISRYGVADLEGLRRDTHDFESRYLEGLVGPWPEAAALYEERAPLHQVEGLSAPVLLLQGDEDRVVPPAQSEVFRDALAAKGIPHAYVLYAGEQHGFRRAETIHAATEASLSFYGQVLGFEVPGVPRLELTTGR